MAKRPHDPTKPVWRSDKGMQVYVSTDEEREVMFVCLKPVTLTKAEAFEMIHEVADRLRRFPKGGL